MVTVVAKKSGDWYHYANGRRKTAVARVRLFTKKGPLVVNDRPIEEYFRVGSHMLHATEALRLVEGDYSATIRVSGGGISGQAGAVRQGLARALTVFNPDFRQILKPAGLMTRDPRAKERKKPGLKRARKAPQYTKR
jgi:small subunit ribosomal protein S9